MLRTPPLPQLLCLPHAGGSAVMFHPWRARFAGAARVVPVELPGHGQRRAEPTVRDFGTLVELLAGELATAVDGPYVLFGHSFGSLVAAALARRLPERSGHAPLALAVSGRNGPSVPHARAPLHNAPTEELLRGLRTLQGTLPAVEQSPELLEVFLPPLRADLEMTETYRWPGPAPLPCPVQVVAGDLDPLVDEPGLAAWQRETTGPCRVARVRGGHMALDSPELHRCLDGLLARAAPVGRRGTPPPSSPNPLETSWTSN
ncbi:thioesterase II family protein [Streptomyces sp. BE230]|uniref:thioesterase II family protein n=1 Tax=Streptomyces sp. BE230 TaxID=3002526 RepID=UPI002ED17948|nr:alpha/beta fold hydrolase [Streptomyces sp. BE230]